MRIRLLVALLASVATGPARGELAAPEPDSRAALTDGYLHVPRKVAGGVWAFVQPKFLIQPFGNVTLIEQSDGFVLIDTGGSPGAGRRIVQHVRALGSKPVKTVVITHWHADHPLGLAEILKAFPRARTISTSATRRHLQNPKLMAAPAISDEKRNQEFRKRGEMYVAMAGDFASKAANDAERERWLETQRVFRRFGEDMDGAVTVAPAEEFETKLLLPDRKRPIELQFLGRANTDGDAIAWLPRQRILISGDVVVAPLPFGFGSFPWEWAAVLTKLEATNFSVLVPGHGEPMRNRTYLRNLRALITDIARQVDKLARVGASLQEVTKKVDVSRHEPIFVGKDPWLKRWFAEYFVTPLIASAYKEAKGEPIEQKPG